MSVPAPADRPGFFRHLLRAGAMALAALSLTWGTALPSGLAAALIGAALGVPVGQALGRSRVRLPVVLLGLAAFAVLGFALAAFAVGSAFFPLRVGTGTALRTAAAIRFGVTALTASAALRIDRRAQARRRGDRGHRPRRGHPLVFASHRDGVIARPLWISDFAWQRGSTRPHLPRPRRRGRRRARRSPPARDRAPAPRRLVAPRARRAHRPRARRCSRSSASPAPHPPDDLGLTDRADGGGKDPRRRRESPRGGAAARARPRRRRQPLDGGGVRSAEESDQLDGGGGPLPTAAPKVAQSEHLEEQGSSKGGEAPMAVVVLDDDYSPPSQGYYFRQEAWSQCNGARLVRASRGDVDGDGALIFPRATTDVADPPLDQGRARVHATVALLVDHTHPFALESPVRFAPAQNPNPRRFLRAYSFESLAQRHAVQGALRPQGG